MPQFLSTYGLSAPGDRVIAHQLLALGLPLNPELVVSLRKWHGENTTRGPLRLRLAALLQDKGLTPTEALVADLETVILGTYADGRGSHNPRRHHRNNPSRGRPPLAVDTETADHGVQIFNHLTGKNGQWVILPVGTNEGPSGSLQLFYPGQSAVYDRAVLTVRSDPYYWGFSWSNPAISRGSDLTIHTDFDGQIPEAELHWVSQVLSGLGIHVDQRLSTDPLPASFAIFQLQAIMKGVDEVV